MVDLNYEEKEAKPSSRLDHVLSLLEFLFGTFANSHEKNGTLAFRVRGEEPDYLVVIKSQASSAQLLGVGRKIQLASQNAGFELHRAVSTIPKALQNRSQLCQEKIFPRRRPRQVPGQFGVAHLRTGNPPPSGLRPACARDETRKLPD